MRFIAVDRSGAVASTQGALRLRLPISKSLVLSSVLPWPAAIVRFGNVEFMRLDLISGWQERKMLCQQLY